MKFVKNLDDNFGGKTRKPLWWGIMAVCGFNLFALGAGCQIPVSWESAWDATSTSPIVSTATSTWQEVEPGIARFDQRLGAEGAAARVILWRIAPEAKLVWSIVTSSTQEKTVGAWADQDLKAVFVLNAGYFHPDGSPSGWVQTRGQSLGTRSFDIRRSGLVLLGDAPTLVAGTTPTSTVHVDAFQSYPWLIDNGMLAFSRETGQYARRTFLGTDINGNWYVGVVPSESISLYQLGRILLGAPVAWKRVINLDGGPSTGLVSHLVSAEDRFDSFSLIPYIIVAHRRP